MGGPIVRTGTNPAFWANWDNVFGGKKKAGATKKSAAKAPAKKTAKAAPKSAKVKSAKKKK